ncbi:MAG: FkbM family methyltransferase [Phycisphaerales bacterium]
MIRLMQSIKLRLHGTKLRGVLKRTGILDFGRGIYNRRIIASGHHEAKILGQELRFAVTSPDEILEIDGLFGEHEFLQRILDTVRENDVFHDIGANIGLVSLLVARKHAGRALRAHAFEPEPRNADRVRANIRANGLESQVFVEACGVGSSSGTLKLFLAGYIGDHSMLDQNRKGEYVEVPVVTLDEFCKTHPAPQSMKIDVEGFELEVMKGAKGVLSSGAVRDVFVEVHEVYLARANLTPEHVHGFMRDCGFKIAWSRPRGGETHVHYTRG